MSARSRLRPLNQWDLYSVYIGPDDGGSHPLYHDGLTDFGVSHAVSPDTNWLSFTSNDEIELLNRLATKVKDHEFNLGVSLFELKEFVPMVADRLTKLAKAVRAVKHGDFATAARQFGSSVGRLKTLNRKGRKTKTSAATPLKVSDVPDMWLELQYGWLPSLNDIYEGSKAFEALSNGPRKSTVTASVWKGSTYNASTAPGSYQAMVQQKLKRYITYEMTEELSAPRQMGLADPASIIWELVPWSFVLDWSLPIGDYLSALGTIPFLKGRFRRTTIRRFAGFYDILYTGNPWGPKWYTYAVPPFPTTDNFRAVELERTVLGSLQVPFPNFKGISKIVSAKNRIANASALLHSAFASGAVTLRKK